MTHILHIMKIVYSLKHLPSDLLQNQLRNGSCGLQHI